MVSLPEHEIAAILAPFYPATGDLLSHLSAYLDLLIKWNARTNLTAIRDPGEIVRLHFGESLFTARYLPDSAQTLLDLGSGAGFPGLPIQLARPKLRVTLAESQGKKASFLREVVRTLGLPTEVWSGRVEALPAARLFDVVALRAVDDPAKALLAAWPRVAEDGILAHLTSATGTQDEIHIPGSSRRVLKLLSPSDGMFHVEQ